VASRATRLKVQKRKKACKLAAAIVIGARFVGLAKTPVDNRLP
jgi:hypothetical protein